MEKDITMYIYNLESQDYIYSFKKNKNEYRNKKKNYSTETIQRYDSATTIIWIMHPMQENSYSYQYFTTVLIVWMINFPFHKT